MITSNSDGNPISQGFIDAMQQPIVGYRMELYAGGSPTGWGVKRARLELGAGSPSSFEDIELGAVYSTQMEAWVYDGSPQVGAELEVRVGVDAGGSYEYVTVASVTVCEVEEWQGVSHVKARGPVSKLNVPATFSGDLTPQGVCDGISIDTGVTVALGGFQTLQTTVHVEDGWTCREALQALAMRLAGFAWESGDGIEVSPYTGAATYTIPAGFVTSQPSIPSEGFEATGLEVASGDASYSYGDGRLQVQDPTATQATADAMWANLQGVSFDVGSIPVAIIDPRVTPADVLSLSIEGSSYSIPVRGISITYDGGYFGIYSSTGLSAEDAGTQVQGEVARRVDAAAAVAEEAKAVAEAVNQHFWTDTEGAHVTEVTRTGWLDPTGADYHSGFNSLWNSLGTLFRSALNNLVSITRSAVAFFDGEGNSSSNLTARFGSDGAQIGKDGDSHLELDYHSMQLIDKEGKTYFHVSDLRNADGLATITDTFKGDGTTKAFNLSMGPNSVDYVVEIDGTVVTSGITKGIFSFSFSDAPSEGAVVSATYVTESNLAKAYTLGNRNRYENIGAMSVAEGDYVVASGMKSRAQNDHTIAEGYSQTALGRYNLSDTTSAVIIGNGTSHSNRSNAMTIDWNGNEWLAGGLEASRVITSGWQIVKDSSLDRDGAAPSANVYSEVLGIQDKDGEKVAYIQAVQRAGGAIGASLIAFNEKDDGTLVQNSLGVQVAKDGTASYSLTSPANFRSAIAAASLAANTFSGAQTAKGVQIIGMSTNLTSNTVPSSGTNGNGTFRLMDNNGATIGYICPHFSPDGTQWFTIYAQRVVGGATKYSTLRLGIDSSGNAQVRLEGTNAQDAWLDALGFTKAVTTAVASVLTAKTGFTCSQVNFVQYGRMAQFYATFKTANALTANTQHTIANVVSGKRPQTWSAVNFSDTDNIYGKGRLVTGGDIIIKTQGAVSAGAQFIIVVPAYILG